MIALGSDHAGFGLKKIIEKYLVDLGYEVKDYGTLVEQRCDYPIFAYKVGRAVASGEAQKGLLFCGTGVGMAIAANKIKGVRCVCCAEPYSARLSRMHNDTNILSMGSRVVGDELAKMIVDEWLKASFEGGRHANRVALFT